MKQTFTYLVAAVFGIPFPFSVKSGAKLQRCLQRSYFSSDFTEGYYVIIKPFLASPLDTETALCGVKKRAKNIVVT